VLRFSTTSLGLKYDAPTKKAANGRQSKKFQIQGTQILRNEAYLLYVAMTKDAAQHRSWTFYEVVKNVLTIIPPSYNAYRTLVD